MKQASVVVTDMNNESSAICWPGQILSCVNTVENQKAYYVVIPATIPEDELPRIGVEPFCLGGDIIIALRPKVER